jgi:hypothetical protein
MFRSTRLVGITLLLAAGITGFFFGILIPQVRAVLATRHMGSGSYFGNDFYPVWFATHALSERRVNPYGDDLTRQIETGIYGRPLVPSLPGDPPRQYRGFSYPLYLELFAWPLARLSFPETQRLLVALFLPLMACTAWLWMRASGLSLGAGDMTIYLLAYLSSYPALESIFALQPSILVAFCIAATSFTLTRRQYLLAGMLLAIASIKPQLTLLMVVWLLIWSLWDWKRRRLFAAGFIGTLVVLMLASEAIFNGWLMVFLRTLALYREFTVPPLVRFVLGAWLSVPVSLFLIGFVAWQCWKTRADTPEESSFQMTLGIVLAVTILLLPTGASVYDHLLLVPAWLWLYQQRSRFAEASQSLRWLGRLVVAELAWPWVAGTAVLLLVLALPRLRTNSYLASVPLRLQVSLPFLTTAVLGLIASREKSVVRDQKAAIQSSH